MDDEARQGLTVLVVGVVGLVLGGLVLFWGPLIGRVLFEDRPRSFDEGELVPLVEGTEVVDPPAEGCPQGRDAVGDCEAWARVRDRDGEPAVGVVAANAEAAGFVAVDAGSDLYRAERGDRCLSVDATTAVTAPDALMVVLTWC